MGVRFAELSRGLDMSRKTFYQDVRLDEPAGPRRPPHYSSLETLLSDLRSSLPRAALSPALRGSLFYLAYYGALAAWVPFINVYFRRTGLSGWQIGWLSALLPAAMFLLAAPLSSLADRPGRHRIMLIVDAIGMGIALLLFLMASRFAALLVFMAVLSIFFSSFTPLADSAISGMALRHGKNYGSMRLWGSFSFALMAVASGFLWQHFGYRPMFVVSALLYVAVAWFGLTLEEAVSPEREVRVPLRVLGCDRLMLILIMSTFLASSATGIDVTFGGIYMTHLGGSNVFVGVLAGISALCELPTMHYSERIAGWMGESSSLLIAYALFAAAYLGYALSPNPEVMIGFSAVRGFGYGLFYAGTIRLVTRRAPEGRASTLQGVVYGFAFGLAQLISRPVGGGIYDSLGPSAVYVACSAASAGALLTMGAAMLLRIFPRDLEQLDISEDRAEVSEPREAV